MTSGCWWLTLRRRRLGRRSDFFRFVFEILHNSGRSALLLGISFVGRGLVGMSIHTGALPATSGMQTAASILSGDFHR